MKKLPDYITRRLPKSQWNKLRDVPTWEGVLYYDPEDFKLDRPLTFYRRMYCWQLHEEIIYPMAGSCTRRLSTRCGRMSQM